MKKQFQVFSEERTTLQGIKTTDFRKFIMRIFVPFHLPQDLIEFRLNVLLFANSPISGNFSRKFPYHFQNNSIWAHFYSFQAISDVTNAVVAETSESLGREIFVSNIYFIGKRASVPD